MVNDRMYLVNRGTGQRVLLAKHSAAEWISVVDVEGKLDLAFVAEIDEFSASQGSTAWEIEYESESS